jgi:methylmalonyl-CoA mutase N-terminal domain/subunit
LAAVLGGTQSLHTNSYDEALALPSEEAVRIALRTQQIIAHESGVTDTVDPLAGSYYVESLTREIEEKAEDYIKRIDAMGGAIRAIESGYIQREIMESAYRYQKEIEARERIVVGVNEYVIEEEKRALKLLKVDPAVRDRQIARLQEVRRRRDNVKVGELLAKLEEAARGSDNLMPVILECVEAYATLGEICDVLRKVFGEYRAPVLL